MINTLFFDLGGVIVEVHEQELFCKLAKVSPFSVKKIANQARDSAEARQLELGLISLKEFYDSTRKALSLVMPYREFVNVFSNMFAPNAPVVELVGRLDGKFQLGLISNTSEAHFDWIRRHIEVVRNLEPVILSFKEHIMKPDRRIFDIALERAECTPEAAVFVDDKAENVAAAQAVGMQAIYYSESIDLKQELNSLGIEID